MVPKNLVKKAKKGDKTAFNELILQYQQDMYNIAKSRLYSEEDVCDVIQETILNAYQSIEKLRDISKFKIWLIKILVNECNKLYLERKKDYYELDEYQEAVTEDISNLEFLNLMNVLNEDEKNIFILYYQEGYTCKEIAQILNLNSNTVRSKLLRGKEKLKNTLKEGM